MEGLARQDPNPEVAFGTGEAVAHGAVDLLILDVLVVHADVVQGMDVLEAVALGAGCGCRPLDAVAEGVYEFQLGGTGVRMAGGACQGVAGGRRDLVVQQLVFIGGDGGIGGCAGQPEVDEAVPHRVVIETGGEELRGGDGDDLAACERLGRCLVLEGVEFGAYAVGDGAHRTGYLVGAGSGVENGGVEGVVAPALAVPEGVFGDQVVGLGRHRLVAVQSRVPFRGDPGTVGFRGFAGCRVAGVLRVFGEVAGLAGDAGLMAVHVLVTVAGGGAGLCGVTGGGGAGHLDSGVLRPEIGAAAGDPVRTEGVAGLAGEIAPVAGCHVGIVEDVCRGPARKGDVAALDRVAAPRFGVAAEAVLAHRLYGGLLHHEVHVKACRRFEEPGGRVTHAGIWCVHGVVVTDQAVDGGKLRRGRVAGGHRFGAGPDMAGAAGAPVPLDVDAVGVEGARPVDGVYLSLCGRACGHLGGGTLPLVVDRLVHSLSLRRVAGAAHGVPRPGQGRVGETERGADQCQQGTADTAQCYDAFFHPLLPPLGMAAPVKKMGAVRH